MKQNSKMGLRAYRPENDEGFGFEGKGDTRDRVPTVQHDSYNSTPRFERNRSFFFRDICLDLFEWSEQHKGEPIQFLIKLVRLFERDPASYQFFIQLVGGNFYEWDLSYGERARLNGCKKQNVQQIDFRRFKNIAELFPELAGVLKEKGGARRPAHNAKS